MLHRKQRAKLERKVTAMVAKSAVAGIRFLYRRGRWGGILGNIGLTATIWIKLVV
jgi:hypothetical protein